MLRRQLITAFKVTIILVVLLGVIYPVAVWGIAQVAFNRQANGSLVRRDGTVVGSSLIGQSFLDKSGNPLPQYFQPRPSDAGAGYDPTSSSPSNFGPTSPKLLAQCLPVQETDSAGNLVVDAEGQPVDERDESGQLVCNPSTVPQRVLAYRQFNHLAPATPVPVDAVTSSGSGLDPDISEANALDQAPRVAEARSLPVSEVVAMVHAHVRSRSWGFLGENSVNVLDLNLAIDRLG